MTSYYLEILLLSIIQGISEFIPVSSSAHLLLFSKIKASNFSSLEIDVSLHLGSLIAIIVYFWKDLLNVYKSKELLNLIFFGSKDLSIFCKHSNAICGANGIKQIRVFVMEVFSAFSELCLLFKNSSSLL